MSRKKIMLVVLGFFMMLSVKMVRDINEQQNEKIMSLAENTASANVINIKFTDGIETRFVGNSLEELGGFFNAGLILNSYKKTLRNAEAWAQIEYLKDNVVLEKGQILIVDEIKLEDVRLGNIDGKACLAYINGIYFALGNAECRELSR